MVAWHWLDYVIVGIVALSVMTGVVRGFLKELVALGVWIIAVWLSFVYVKPVSTWLGLYIQDKTGRVVLAYVLIVVGTLLVGGICNSILSFIMHRSGLSGTDRLLGLGFGLVRGVFIVSLLMVVIKITAMPEEEYRQKSLFYAQFNPIVNWLYQYAPDLIKRVETLEHDHESQPESQKQADLVVRNLDSL